MALQPISPDEFRAAVFSRFAEPLLGMTSDQLETLLNANLFNQSLIMTGFLEQVRLIGDKLAGNHPADPDLLSLMKVLLDNILATYQQSILLLPQVVIQACPPTEFA